MKPFVCWRSVTFILILANFLISCRTTKSSENPQAETKSEENVVRGLFPQQDDDELPPYRATLSRTWDLLHTRLDLAFDWKEQAVIGKATLRLKPYFYTQNALELDARGFSLHAIRIPMERNLPYTYDSTKISIQLPKDYNRGDTLEVEISYTAHPALLDSLGLEEGAGQGLYFINHDGSSPSKPQQIWTQGETQANSCWFPTIDRPVERCTQEMVLTVQERFKTLSNGVLISSKSNGNGTRTDHWEMRHTHSPYLFMMAIGEFAVVKDEWRGKEVNYYVEPEYEQYARLVFGKTPRMLEFFSEKLGVAFPWDKYSQVVVQDFVSGAMENTTATIHMSGLQHDDRAHLDNPYEDYVSHELMHQWFGDLVTCESWANLALNEGFATYGEFLWLEHDAGADVAAEHLLSDRLGYLGEARYVTHPLIHFHYADREDMFDNHSYAKGGQIVHMLRHLLGDEAFFASVQHYLTENAFSAVESHDMRLAFEETTGRDLNWFFNQWFFSEGHPVIEVRHLNEFDMYQLEVVQTQSDGFPKVFQFPISVGVRENGKYREHKFWISSRDTTLTIPGCSNPEFVTFNADGVLLADITQKNKSLSQWSAQVEHGVNFFQKRAALTALEDQETSAELYAVYRKAIRDPFWGVTTHALGNCPTSDTTRIADFAREVVDMIGSQSVEERNAAIRFFNRCGAKLYESWDWTPKERSALIGKLEAASRDKSYVVERNSVRLLHRFSPKDGARIAGELMPKSKVSQQAAYIKILAEENDPSVMKYTKDLLKVESWSGRIGAFEALSILASKHGADDALAVLKVEAVEQEPWWMRMMVARAMRKLTPTEELNSFYQERAEEEEKPQLQKAWSQMIK